MSNLNIDDLFENTTDFDIEINIPKDYVLESTLYQYKTKKENSDQYYLIGKQKTDVIISIQQKKHTKLLKQIVLMFILI